MPKIASKKGLYVPRGVEFRDDLGRRRRNEDFPPSEQVKVELQYADLAQKNRYMQFVYRSGKDKEMETRQDYDFNTALRKHVKKIENLFDDDDVAISDGFKLVACDNHELNDLKLDLFHRICGIRLDDEPDDGPGEFLPGEGMPSS